MTDYCEACNVQVKSVWDHMPHTYDLNYTDTGKGPYCDKCWHWQKQIEELKELLNESTDR
jgi:hypothetical protein